MDLIQLREEARRNHCELVTKHYLVQLHRDLARLQRENDRLWKELRTLNRPLWSRLFSNRLPDGRFS